MKLVKMREFCLQLICSIAFFSFILNAFSRPDWTSFQNSHVLNPSEPQHENFDRWTQNSWENWLKVRDGIDETIKSQQFRSSVRVRGKPKSRRGLEMKKIHSVIISSPEQILNAFNSTSEEYISNGTAYHWSNYPFHLYNFRSQQPLEKVVLCPSMYFVALLSVINQNGSNYYHPVHFERFGRDKIPQNDPTAQVPWNLCTSIPVEQNDP